jgi:hypothetical protein
VKQSPKDVEKSVRTISRRALVVGGVQLAFMAALGLRMRQLQIEEAEQYRLLAEENRINMRLIPPARGLIFDRNGVVIADNMQNYRIVIVREDAGDVEETVARLRRLIGMDETELARALAEMERRSPFVPVTLADQLSWEDFSRVAVNAPALPGITTEVGLSRHYPMGRDFAHVVGYVGPFSEFDQSRIEDPDPLFQIPRFPIGKLGVEARYEDELRGKAGTRKIEINAAGRVMRELGRDEGTPGADIQLTCDYRLTNFIKERLKGESAAVVVMDVENGDLVAIASSPAYDPNLFVRGISGPDYRALTEDKYRPLADKTVQGTYPPGSTYKMVTALAALQDGKITPNETVWCPGHYRMGNRRFHCWKRGGHGHVNLNRSLVESCDVYYYDVAQRVGIDRISEVANQLGLGDAPRAADVGHRRGPRAHAGLEGDPARRALAAGRHAERHDRPGLHARLALAARGDDGAARDGPGGGAAAREVGGRRRGASRAPAAARLQPRMVPPDRQGAPRHGERPVGHGMAVADRGRRDGDGRQDRHEPGPQHHRGRTRPRRHLERPAALGAARPRALRLLRPIRPAEIRLLGRGRARRRRVGRRGAGRAGHHALRALRGPAADRGLSRPTSASASPRCWASSR